MPQRSLNVVSTDWYVQVRVLEQKVGAVLAAFGEGKLLFQMYREAVRLVVL